jgi:peptidoglycan/xylan/chitin deacetylase (PgdA/CDA1 family)
MYHRIQREVSSYPYAVSSEQFEQHLLLASRLDQEPAESFLQAIFTFDDGHSSNYHEALPLLARHQRSAWFFVTAGWIGRRAEFMSWEELRGVYRSGHRIGAHGFTHKMFTICSNAELDDELHRSKDVLEQNLGVEVDTISLPGGRWNARVLQACAAAGYRKVFTSDPGTGSSMRQGVQIIPRINVSGSFTAEQLRQLLTRGSGLLYRLRLKHGVKQLVQHLLGERLYHAAWCRLFGWTNDEEMHSMA